MQSPHDTLFGFTFRHRHHAAGWVRSVLPAVLAAAVDWSTLAPIRERFPGARLRPHLADSGFVATLRLHGGEATDVLLLLEHKSHDDSAVEAQLLRYAVHLRRALQDRPGNAPFVLAVLLRHGGTHRSDGDDGHRPGEAASELLATLLEAQPRQPMFVDDLDAANEADLLARDQTPLATLTQLCLKFLRQTAPEDVARCFERWQHLLRAVDGADAPPTAPPLGADAVDAIGWYALAVTNVDSLELAETFSRILHHDDHAIMSTLERTFQKGRAAGQAYTLLQQLALRFGPVDDATTTRVQTGSPADLERWTARVLTAPTLAAVFEDERRA